MRRYGWLVVFWALGGIGLGADFPTYQGNFARTGFISRGGGAPLVAAGSASVGAIAGSCTKADNQFLFGDDSPAVQAVDSGTGQKLFSVTTSAIVYAAPTVDAGKAYVGAVDGTFYAIDLGKGTILASVNLKGEIQGSAAADNGELFVPVGYPRNALVVLDEATLSVKREKKFSQPLLSAPALSGDTVVVSVNDQSVVALSASSLQQLWRADVGAATGYYAPAIAGGRVYAIGGDLGSRVVALDLATGSEIWSVPLTTQAVAKGSSLAVTSDRLYFVWGGNPAQLFALDPGTGATLWTQSVGSLLDYSYFSPPIATSAQVFLGTPDGTFSAFDKNGTALGSFPLGGKVVGAACGGHGLFGVGDLAGTFSIFKVASDSISPTAEILSPAEGASTGSHVSVTGSAQDVNFKKWVLTLKESSGAVVAQQVGYGEVSGGALGSFTTSRSGSYQVELTAWDVRDNQTTVKVNFTSDHTKPQLTVSSPADGLVTKEASVVVSGSSSGSSVTVNGQPVSLDPQGNFSAGVNLTEGSNTISVVAVNALGNTETVQRTVTRDSLPPQLTVTSPSDNFMTSQPALVISGSTSQAASLLVNGTSVPLNADGTFSTQTTLKEGANAIQLQVLDSAGNSASQLLSGVLDTQPPPLSITSPQDGTTTAQPTLSVAGVAEAGAIVTVNGSTASVDASGNFSGSIPLVPGKQEVTVVAKDAAGNATQKVLTVTLNASASPVVLEAPVDGLVTGDANLLVKGVALDAESLTVQGSHVSVAPDGSFQTTVLLAEGSNTIVAQATLSSGLAATAQATVILDTKKPTGSLLLPEATHQSPLTVQLQGEDNVGLKSVEVSESPDFANAQLLPLSGSQGSATTSVSLTSDGTHTLYARFTDLAGNQQIASASVLLDTHAPTGTLTPDLPKPYLTGDPKLSFTLAGEDSGGSGLLELWVSEDSSFAAKTVVPVSSSPTTFTFTLSSLSGEKTVYGRLFDRAGNSLDLSVQVTLESGSVAVLPLSQAVGTLKLADGTVLALTPVTLKQKSSGAASAYLVVRTPAAKLPKPQDPDLLPTDVAKEILIVDANGTPLPASLSSVQLTLSTQGKLAGVPVEGLRIFSLADGAYELLPGMQSVDKTTGSATATLSSPGTYRLMAVSSNQRDFLAEVYNYPNPFSGLSGTTVSYRLKSDAQQVSIDIYTLSGAKVNSVALFQGGKGALIGRNRVKLAATTASGQPLPNGVYFYRVVATDPSGHRVAKVGKLVVLR